jgi:hypothetical protein
MASWEWISNNDLPLAAPTLLQSSIFDPGTNRWGISETTGYTVQHRLAGSIGPIPFPHAWMGVPFCTLTGVVKRPCCTPGPRSRHARVGKWKNRSCNGSCQNPTVRDQMRQRWRFEWRAFAVSTVVRSMFAVNVWDSCLVHKAMHPAVTNPACPGVFHQNRWPNCPGTWAGRSAIVFSINMRQCSTVIFRERKSYKAPLSCETSHQEWGRVLDALETRQSSSAEPHYL